MTGLQGMCPPEKSISKSAVKAVLEADQQETILQLLPDFTYTISVAAVNRAGKGKTASETRTTLEEGRV